MLLLEEIYVKGRIPLELPQKQEENVDNIVL
jgi:hypothetical protein